MSWDGITLAEHIENLLRDGKRSQHPDFQTLFTVYGKDKVVAMAKEILDRLKNEKPDPDDA